jgi:hypothetical protein
MLYQLSYTRAGPMVPRGRSPLNRGRSKPRPYVSAESRASRKGRS